jgi:hypothetical protein
MVPNFRTFQALFQGAAGLSSAPRRKVGPIAAPHFNQPEDTMKEQSRNAWKRHNGIDNLFNGGIIGLAIAGLLVAVLVGPELEASAKPASHGTTAILGARA